MKLQTILSSMLMNLQEIVKRIDNIEIELARLKKNNMNITGEVHIAKVDRSGNILCPYCSNIMSYSIRYNSDNKIDKLLTFYCTLQTCLYERKGFTILDEVKLEGI